jgi:hypothetical protein
MVIRSYVTFYPRFRLTRSIDQFVDGYRIIRRAQSSAERAPYVDTALTPAEEDDFEHLAMFTATAGAEPAIARKRRQDKIRVEFGATAKHGE